MQTGSLVVDTSFQQAHQSSLHADARAGLAAPAKHLPPKHFYDARGSELFDAICETPEYYPTRTEAALLASYAADIIARTGASDLVELGSGAARKTPLLLRALMAHHAKSGANPRYVPLDVSQSMLEKSAHALQSAFEGLDVHGMVGDFLTTIAHLPAADTRLLVFLGSTIGNFAAQDAAAFLGQIAASMRPTDRLLVGFDLVKSTAVLDAAYNDAAGVTAAFNRNMLRVLNRELGATFAEDAFEHVAFFNEKDAQIEMHLEAREAHSVHIEALGIDVALEKGERIHTETSRKFTRQSAAHLFAEAGLAIDAWYQSYAPSFALALCGTAGTVEHA